MKHRYFGEFFAGIGLVHAGLKDAGWSCAYANDIDPKKREMYGHRFGDLTHYHLEDIWATDEVLARIAVPLELATASFPCVDLSQAGKGRGLRGKSSGTFFGFLEVMRGLKKRGQLPAQVLIENVMGFLSANSGTDFRWACEALSELGYWLDVIVVDAKHFTPQSRPRLFIVGALAARVSGDSFHEVSQDVTDTDDPLRPKKLREALSRLQLQTGLFQARNAPLPPEQRMVEEILDLHCGQWWEHQKVEKHLNEMSENHRSIIEGFRRGDAWKLGTMYRRVRRGTSRTEIRWDGLAGCLRTPRGGSSKQMVFAAGFGELKMRWMQPKEYAALQGEPDFPLHVSNHQALFGFGDAVCVPAISWIAEQYFN